MCSQDRVLVISPSLDRTSSVSATFCAFRPGLKGPSGVACRRKMTGPISGKSSRTHLSTLSGCFASGRGSFPSCAALKCTPAGLNAPARGSGVGKRTGRGLWRGALKIGIVRMRHCFFMHMQRPVLHQYLDDDLLRTQRVPALRLFPQQLCSCASGSAASAFPRSGCLLWTEGTAWPSRCIRLHLVGVRPTYLGARPTYCGGRDVRPTCCGVRPRNEGGSHIGGGGLSSVRRLGSTSRPAALALGNAPAAGSGVGPDLIDSKCTFDSHVTGKHPCFL